MDYCKYVNIFQGCGEIDLPKAEGIAAKWFFIKAGCGNTSPAATVPFGAMSAAPYSGGYPTGYGNHKPNSHSRPPKFEGGNKLLGFAHIQQSGTGAIGYYYNYALTVPKYSDSKERRVPANEKAKPGYYSCELEDILCELTASKKTAFHRYTFGRENGLVEIDFSNNGLMIPDNDKAKVFELKVEKKAGNIAAASAFIEGINIFFAVKGNSDVEINGSKAIFKAIEKESLITVSISLISVENAMKHLDGSFDEAEKNAYDEWNKVLSRIKIEIASDEIKEIFYSNLYHSFIKPSDWSGESFIYETGKPFMSDFATLWDMYKTALPLILMTDKKVSEDICETLLLTGEKLGNLPNCIGLTDRYKEFSEQARMLGAYVLMTAYRYGISLDPHRMVKVICDDVFAPNKTDFVIDGKCRSHTWMLDMADGCALAAQIADEIGETEISEKLKPLSAQWIKCFDPETGLLNNDSSYYEGTLYNYSFRQMVDMERRIGIAGGKDRFVELLDRFFGYGAEDVINPTDPFDYSPVEEGIKLGRFEGFNNESDTEAPFTYNYIGRHDRICEIIRAGMKYMFTTGRGGLPGNNDSDALSSYYVLNAVGLFPVAGQDLFILGSPAVDSAEILLSSGKTLKINVINNSDENIYVEKATFNSLPIDNFTLTAKQIMDGGTIEFIMTDKT